MKCPTVSDDRALTAPAGAEAESLHGYQLHKQNSREQKAMVGTVIRYASFQARAKRYDA